MSRADGGRAPDLIQNGELVILITLHSFISLSVGAASWLSSRMNYQKVQYLQVLFFLF